MNSLFKDSNINGKNLEPAMNELDLIGPIGPKNNNICADSMKHEEVIYQFI